MPKSRKIDLLVHLLRDQTLDSVLVFSRTKHGADKIARKLQQAGIDAATLHSNRIAEPAHAGARRVQERARRVLVATDIASRGIDVEGISHVINFDFPMHPEDYVHRIGRTGRAQAIGDAISFVTPDDEQYVRLLEKMIAARSRASGSRASITAKRQNRGISPSIRLRAIVRLIIFSRRRTYCSSSGVTKLTASPVAAARASMRWP